MSFKICVIGCGWHSTEAHGPSYKKYAEKNKDVILAACCDVNPETAKDFKEEFCFQRCYTNYVEMLEKERPDAVGLITPIALTASISIRLLEMGYPVILEKPTAVNIEQAKSVYLTAEKTGTPCMVAHNRRYAPLTKLLMSDMLESHSMQKIHTIKYDISRVKRGDEDFSYTAIHGIDLVRYVADSDYKQIIFTYQEVQGYNQKATNVFMNCTMKNGIKAFLHFMPLAGDVSERLSVHTIDSAYYYDFPNYNELTRHGHLKKFNENKLLTDFVPNEQAQEPHDFISGGFYQEISEFMDKIRSKEIFDCKQLQSTLQSIEIADYIRKLACSYSA